MKKYLLLPLAALLLCGATSARAAANVPAQVQLATGEVLQGSLSWLPADKKYVLGVKQGGGPVIEKKFSASDVVQFRVKEPQEWAGLRQAAAKTPDAALARLQAFAEGYRRLQWDGEAGALIAQILLRKGQAKQAIDACRKIVQGNDRAAWDSPMAPFYWQAMIESGSTTGLAGLLDKAATSPDRNIAGQACIKRGDLLDQEGKTADALKDGYLRGVFLFADLPAVQAEALYKAAVAFDKRHQAANAEKMRQQLTSRHPGSSWTKKLSSAD